jgi:hypothetical protein
MISITCLGLKGLVVVVFFNDVMELYCNLNQNLNSFLPVFLRLFIPVSYVNCFTLKDLSKSNADINKLVLK